jgi:hypothetical protein
MSMTCSACESAASTTCTLCQAALCNEHIQKGQPFITARQLVATTTVTAFRTPQLLGDILFKELDEVPYCATCRQEVAVKRQSEQMKFLLGVLLVMLLAVSVPLYLLLAG